VTLDKLNPDTLPTPGGYTQVVVATGGRIIYVSGQVAVDAGGEVVAPGDAPAQARQAFLNLRAALEGSGASVADVAKLTWYVVGYRPELLPALAASRADVFGDHAPASTLIGVQALAQPEYLVEVEAVAILG
jgi:enamine deaminase RidA (YjgF/YER057c/UK114 family)